MSSYQCSQRLRDQRGRAPFGGVQPDRGGHPVSTDEGSADYWRLVGELAALRDRRLGRQPSDRKLAAIASVSPTTIGAWLRGASFPQEADQLLLVVRAIGTEARRLGLAATDLGPLLDEDEWRQAYRAEAGRRAAAVGAASAALKPSRPWPA